MVERAKKQKRLVRKVIEYRHCYYFVAPLLILVLAFVVYPILESLRMCFYEWRSIGHPVGYVGLENFYRIARDALFWRCFGHSVIYTFTLVPIQLTFALLLALILNNPKLRGRNTYRALFFVPVVTTPAVIGIVFWMLLRPNEGVITVLLGGLHLIDRGKDLLGSKDTALACIIAVGIWQTLGYNMVYFLAGLQTIPSEIYEAADIDGAGKWTKLRHVTLPMLKPVVIVITLLAILGSLRVFDLVKVMTNGQPADASNVVTLYIYNYAFPNPQTEIEASVGLAAAAAFFMGILTLGLTGIQVAVGRKLSGRRKGA